MKLKDKLPIEFMSCEYESSKARKFADIEVVQEYDARKEPWIGTHKNVTYWFVLKNGYAVGLNENLGKGLSFPVVKLDNKKIIKEQNMDKLNFLLEKGYIVELQKGCKNEVFLTLNSTIGCIVKAIDKKFMGETLEDALNKALEFIKKSKYTTQIQKISN
jgi:hypothetical protein